MQVGSDGCRHRCALSATLRSQHDGAGRLALFEGRVCVGDMVQRVGVPDRGLDNPGSDCGEHIIGTLTVLLRIRGVRRERRPGQEEGARIASGYRRRVAALLAIWRKLFPQRRERRASFSSNQASNR